MMNAEMDGAAAPQMADAKGGAALASNDLNFKVPDLKIRKEFPETWIYSTIDDFGLVANLSDNSECSLHIFTILLHHNLLLITTFL